MRSRPTTIFSALMLGIALSGTALAAPASADTAAIADIDPPVLKDNTTGSTDTADNAEVVTGENLPGALTAQDSSNSTGRDGLLSSLATSSNWYPHGAPQPGQPTCKADSPKCRGYYPYELLGPVILALPIFAGVMTVLALVKPEMFPAQLTQLIPAEFQNLVH